MENLYFTFHNGSVRYGGHFTYEDDAYLIAAEGEILSHGERFSLAQVAEYLRGGGNVAELDGLYSMIIFDKRTERVTALQDIFSYAHPLYYSLSGDGICIALFLRQIITETDLRPQLVRENIAEFLYNGFLTDDRCLICGVGKVPVMHVMTYDCPTRQVAYTKRTFPIEGDEGDYFGLIGETLSDVLNGKEEVDMALSSGFDSNFILGSVRRIDPSCKVNAYTIGATNNNDETQNVKKICSLYRNVSLDVSYVSPDTLQCLPALVWELEDSVFERGIFLQYVMGEHLAKKGVRSVLLGEGADQVLSSEFTTAATPYYYVGNERHFPWVDHPYEMLTYIILKKNGIILRNRDIKAHYPFLKTSFIRGVSAFRKQNGTSKEHYKAYVRSFVGKDVGEILSKRPGTTNLSTLFDEKNLRILDAAKQSYLYGYLPKQPERGSGEEAELDNCLKVLFLMVFEEIFCRQGKENLQSGTVGSLDAVLGEILRREGGTNP